MAINAKVAATSFPDATAFGKSPRPPEDVDMGWLLNAKIESARAAFAYLWYTALLQLLGLGQRWALRPCRVVG